MTRKNKLYIDWIHDKTNDIKLIKYKEYKTMLQKLIRLSKVNYFNDKCYEYKNDSKKLWNLINKINGKLNDKSTIINQITIDNLLITNQQEIANKFAEFFSTVGPSFARKIGSPAKVITDYNKKIPLNKMSLYMYPTNSEEIKSVINNMLNKTSTGYDGISNKLLKGIKSSILNPLTIIFNQSMSQGIFPKAMKEASVVPLFKAENTEILNNYRPISLLITVSKILEKLIYTRTYNFLSKTDQLYVSQYGFRQNHSCNDAVNELSMQILKNLEENKFTVSIFLDLSKAFDTLDHEILLEKMSRYGIRGHTNDWFRSYLEDRTIKCKLTNESGKKIFSNPFNLKFGMPQGSCLGPLLFLIFINDLYLHIENCNAILFADDTTIYQGSKYPKYLKWCGEEDLKRLDDWFKAKKLTLNLKKSQMLIFEPAGQNFGEKINLAGSELKRLKTAKFLGITLDENFSWKVHFSNIILKMKRNLHILRTSQKIMSIHAKKLIYFGHLQSHLINCLNVWGNLMNACNIKQLQKIQNTSLKLIFGNNKHVENRANHGILSIPNLILLENYKFVFKYVNKLLPITLITELETDSRNQTW